MGCCCRQCGIEEVGPPCHGANRHKSESQPGQQGEQRVAGGMGHLQRRTVKELIPWLMSLSVLNTVGLVKCLTSTMTFLYLYLHSFPKWSCFQSVWGFKNNLQSGSWRSVIVVDVCYHILTQLTNHKDITL